MFDVDKFTEIIKDKPCLSDKHFKETFTVVETDEPNDNAHILAQIYYSSWAQTILSTLV